MAAQQPSSAATSHAHAFAQVAVPILGDRRVNNAASTTTQQNHESASHAANEYTQQVQNSTSDAGPSDNKYSQHLETHAGPLSGGYIQGPTSYAGASTDQQSTLKISYPSFSGGNDGEDEDHGCEADDEDESNESEDADEDTEDGENDEDTENEEDEGNDGDDEDGSDDGKEPDVEMLLPLPEEDPRMLTLPPEKRRLLTNYLNQDREHLMMYAKGKISGEELMLGRQKSQAELLSGIKRARWERARWEVTGVDEVEESQNRRAKRTRRGGDAAGSSGQLLPRPHLQQGPGDQRTSSKEFGDSQPSFKGLYNHQGAKANTSSRLATRPVGSAVQRLHSDRLRRPAPKATQNKTLEFPKYPQPDTNVYIVNANYYTNTAEPQPRSSSHRQRRPGSERISSTLNPTVENSAGDIPFHVQNNPSEDYNSRDSENESNLMEPARNDTKIESRRAHQQPAASDAQDDPFFSDELYDGMLNGQPESRHVGRMYTRSRQAEIDEYYQRLTTPRPRVETETNNPEAPLTPPQQYKQGDPPSTVFVADLTNPLRGPQAGLGRGASLQNIPHGTHGPAQGANAPPIAQVASRTPQPAEEQDHGLVVGHFTDWDPAWRAFINDHDAKPLLRGHYPDEYR